MQRVSPISKLIVVLAVVGGITAFGYSRMRSSHADSDSKLVSAPQSERPAVVAKSVPDVKTPVPASPPDRVERSSQPATPETVSRWIVEATSDDAPTRAAAIVALADAPRSQALPVLKKVLSTGEPQVDRQLALSSLHALAVDQGDADGRIRSALRDAIYHGDDESVGQGAQVILEDIDKSAGK